MTKTFMRVDKKLLEQLRERKQVARESYSDVIKRMIRNETDSIPKNKDGTTNWQKVNRTLSKKYPNKSYEEILGWK